MILHNTSHQRQVGQRLAIIQLVTSEILSLLGDGVTRVGIDGVDGAGKTCFADEIARQFSTIKVIRSSVDGFHNPKAIRYLKGKRSPEGFFIDSYDYCSLKKYLLDPLSPGGSMQYVVATFDYRTDQRVECQTEIAEPRTILIFDGIFLHRPELASYWDYSVFLEVSTEESVRRCVLRAGGKEVSTDPSDPEHTRYVLGQKLYLNECQPKTKATRIIDNNDLDHPFIAA